MLFEEWKKVSENHADENAEIKFWEEFLKIETVIYNNILADQRKHLKGTVKELASQYSTTEVNFMGFLDGINDSLVESLDLDSIDVDTVIDIEIDWEKLYYNMVNVEAHWLYNLKGWNNILSVDHRKQVQKEFNRSKIVVKEERVGRNDPCPCGSGKKYKKCCGK